MTREDLFGIGLTRANKIRKGFWGGLSTGSKLGITSVALVGFQAARSSRGGFVPSIVGQGLALSSSVVLTGVASAALCLIPGVGPVTAAIVGSVLADYPEYMLGTYLSRKVRLLTDAYKDIRHLEMGGRYKDTESAQRQRAIAIQDMNAAMIPGRRFLGQEAVFMHR